MIRQSLICLTLLVFSSSLLAAPQLEKTMLENNSSEKIEVIDDDGITHTFDQPVQRIVSLMPHATELSGCRCCKVFRLS